MMPRPLPNRLSARRSRGLVLIIGLVAAAGATAAPATNAPAPFAQGRLETIDLFNKTLVLQTKQGPSSFAWTERTFIFFGKQQLPAEKLKPGDQLAIRHYPGPDGTMFILRMKVYRNGEGRPPEPVPISSPQAPLSNSPTAP